MSIAILDCFLPHCCSCTEQFTTILFVTNIIIFITSSSLLLPMVYQRNDFI